VAALILAAAASAGAPAGAQSPPPQPPPMSMHIRVDQGLPLVLASAASWNGLGWHHAGLFNTPLYSIEWDWAAPSNQIIVTGWVRVRNMATGTKKFLITPVFTVSPPPHSGASLISFTATALVTDLGGGCITGVPLHDTNWTYSFLVDNQLIWGGAFMPFEICGSGPGSAIYTELWFDLPPLPPVISQMAVRHSFKLTSGELATLTSSWNYDLAEVATCPADLNGDGVVNGLDLGPLLAAWGSSGNLADLNGDGVVNGLDLAILLLIWGSC
jgi:hypothetical protein